MLIARARRTLPILIILIVLITVIGTAGITQPIHYKYRPNSNNYDSVKTVNTGNGLSALLSSSKGRDAFENAMNSTLGFEKIVYINIATRYDRDDTMFLQARGSELDVERFVAVTPEDFSGDGYGFPPSSNDKEPLTIRQAACYRSHVDLWKKMLRNNWKTLLVLEADATWDVNLKEINYRVAENLHRLREEVDHKVIAPNPDDPFGSEYWDMLSFGTCHDGEKFKDEFVVYKDPSAPDDAKYFDKELHSERVVRRSGDLVCTTGYAISQSGAEKLLARSTLDFNHPVDLVMGEMIKDESLTTFATYPATIAQWQYVKGIGADYLGSSVLPISNDEYDADRAAKVWDQVHREKSIWRLRDEYKDVLKNMAVSVFCKASLLRKTGHRSTRMEQVDEDTFY